MKIIVVDDLSSALTLYDIIKNIRPHGAWI